MQNLKRILPRPLRSLIHFIYSRIAYILILLVLLALLSRSPQHSPKPPKPYTEKNPEYDPIAVAVKSGRDVFRDRLPAQLLTFLAPVRNILLIGDAKDVTLGDLSMHDVVSGTPGHSPSLKKRDLTGVVVDETTKGWKSDAFKNIPGFKRLYDTYPSAKWFVMIDDDTYLFMQTLHTKLKTLDYTKPIYTGAQSVFKGCDGVTRKGDGPYFAHGGAGIVLSRAAVLRLIEVGDECMQRYQDCWAGDVRVALCLRDAGITYKRLAGVGFNSRAPNDGFNYTRTHPCIKAISFHRLLPAQIQRMYDLEKSTRPEDVRIQHVFSRFMNETTLTDSDRGGEPYHVLRAGSVRECRNACLDDTNCVTYTYHGKAGTCALRHDVMPVKKSPGSFNGIVKSHYIC